MNRNRLITRLVGILPSITLVLSCWSPTCVAQTAVTPKGYWKYLSHEVKPRPEEAPKALPGHLLEARATGSVDIPGGKAMLASVWKTDDVDRKPFTMEGSFGISASQTLAALVPGTKVTLQGSGDVTGNSNAASLPANGRFTVGVDNADFVFEISDVKVSHSGSGKGEFTVHNAQPGEKMVITLSSYLASTGAYDRCQFRNYRVRQNGEWLRDSECRLRNRRHSDQLRCGEFREPSDGRLRTRCGGHHDIAGRKETRAAGAKRYGSDLASQGAIRRQYELQRPL